ncbi:hypothetical protein [Clostridium sp. AM58-1XD]|uniref:hypothetical protein n=1 Tax=Clostridium sp. AM58-1XD TaxID=2292307 RepID=UPI0011C17825|nr:hypothetical protein [Clostridium sp. AM58-1XD]
MIKLITKPPYILLFLLSASALLLSTGCSRQKEPSPLPPETEVFAETIAPMAFSEQQISIPSLTVVSEEGVQEIPSSSGNSSWSFTDDAGNMHSAVACGSDPLIDLIEHEESIPYAELGSTFQLLFDGGPAPDSIEIEDIILNENGSHKYNDSTINRGTLECTDKTAVFTLNQNSFALLSSDMSTYEKGGVIRGFRVICSWDNGSSAEYGFVLRTDAQPDDPIS